MLFHGALHVAGCNSRSNFGQNLAAAMAPGGSRSSFRASAGSTAVAGEMEARPGFASSVALHFLNMFITMPAVAHLLKVLVQLSTVALIWVC